MSNEKMCPDFNLCSDSDSDSIFDSSTTSKKHELQSGSEASDSECDFATPSNKRSKQSDSTILREASFEEEEYSQIFSPASPVQNTSSCNSSVRSAKKVWEIEGYVKSKVEAKNLYLKNYTFKYTTNGASISQ